LIDHSRKTPFSNEWPGLAGAKSALVTVPFLWPWRQTFRQLLAVQGVQCHRAARRLDRVTAPIDDPGAESAQPRHWRWMCPDPPRHGSADQQDTSTLVIKQRGNPPSQQR